MGSLSLTVAVEELELVVSAIVGLFSCLLLGKARTHPHNTEHVVKHVRDTVKHKANLSKSCSSTFSGSGVEITELNIMCVVAISSMLNLGSHLLIGEAEPSCLIQTPEALRVWLAEKLGVRQVCLTIVHVRRSSGRP